MPPFSTDDYNNVIGALQSRGYDGMLAKRIADNIAANPSAPGNREYLEAGQQWGAQSARQEGWRQFTGQFTGAVDDAAAAARGDYTGQNRRMQAAHDQDYREQYQQYEAARAHQDAVIGAFHANRAAALSSVGVDPVAAVQIAAQLYAPHFKAMRDAVPPPQPVPDHHAAIKELMAQPAQPMSNPPPSSGYLRMPAADENGKRPWLDHNVLSDLSEIYQPHGDVYKAPSKPGFISAADLKDNVIDEGDPTMPKGLAAAPPTIAPNYSINLNPEDVIDERGSNDLPEGLEYPTGMEHPPKGNATHNDPLANDYKPIEPVPATAVPRTAYEAVKWKLDQAQMKADAAARAERIRQGGDPDAY